MNPDYVSMVKEEIENLLKEQFIAKFDSNGWLFPIVVVPRKNRKLRVCVDYVEMSSST